MRILHVGKYYPPYRGGMETALQHLAEGLLEGGAEVSVITAGHGAADSRETLRAPGTDRTGTLLRAAVRGVLNSQPLTPGLVGLLRREIALFAPDVVHLHLPNPLAAAAWLGLEAVRWEIPPPLAVWFREELRPFVEDTLSPAALSAGGVFRREAVRRILDDHFARRANYDNQIWALLMFVTWQQAYLGSVFEPRTPRRVSA